MKTKRCFAGLNPGDKCTGTIHFYGLNSNWLLRAGMIEADGPDWIFVADEPQENMDYEEDYEDDDRQGWGD